MQKLRLSLTSSCSTTTTQNDDLDPEESCGFQFGCGFYKTKRCPAKICQMFATTRWALLFFGLGALIQGFVVTGHTSAIISTLERRFELTSTESGLIASCYDIAGSIAILFVTYIGGNGHKPLWIGWGIFLIGIGGVVFSLPHFIAPQYTFSDALNLCGNATIEVCTISALKNFRFVFYAAMLLVGVGASPIFSLGITYLDENVKQRYSSLYNGILIMFSIIGPGFGFLAGGALLSFYTNPSEEVTINETSEMWIGAWWIGALISGFVGVLASLPVLMLPKVIPGTEKHREGREKEMHNAAREDGEDENFGKRFRDLPKCVLILFRNPTFVFESLAIALDSLLIGGMALFGAKYLETQFGLDASSSGTYFGILAILGGAGGQLAGGWVISKYDFKMRWMLHICYIAPLLCVFASLGYLITCSKTAFAGVTLPYSLPTSANSIELTSQCNSECSCSSGLFNPVCGSDDVTYFSACFAGCSEMINDRYSNCSCISSSGNKSIFTTATVGVCVDESCSTGWQMILFCVCNFFLLFFTFFNEAPALQVSLRCVAFSRRSFAIGIQILILRTVGTFPGPLAVGAIFDLNCLHWSEECGIRGSCLAYNNSDLALHIFLFLAIGKLLNVVLFVGGLLSYKPISNDQSTPLKEIEAVTACVDSKKIEPSGTLSENQSQSSKVCYTSFCNPLYKE